MPRPKKPHPTNSVIASAARLTSRRIKGRPGKGETAWQDEAWRMLDTVGELEFYRELMSNALSQVTLYVDEIQADGTKKRVTSGDPVRVLAELFDGEAGQAEMLAAMGGHLAVPGETWLVGLVDDDPGDLDAPDQWRVLSQDEVKQQGSKWTIERGDGVKEEYEDGSKEGAEAEALIIRIWRPHPRRWVEATSSVRSALPILRELEGLTQHVAAGIDSRLAGAGVLFVPQEMTFASPNGAEPPENPNEDPFMVALTEAMVTGINDRGSASAVVPIVAKVPAAYVDSIQHITFDSPLSEQAMELRKEALQRLATSLDVPAEVMTGMGDVNHWGAWLTDENTLKQHINPMVDLITHGLTTRFLWPALQGQAATFDPMLRRFVISGDTSALRQRPNRSAEAQAMHAQMILTDKALMRETGFDDGDLLMPNSEEYRRRMLQRTADGVTTADVTVAALDALGVTLTPKPSEAAAPPEVTAEQVPGPAAIPAPVTPVENRRNPPEQVAALLLSSELAVNRAVERAWNRIGKRSANRRPADPEHVANALTDAWGALPRIAAVTGVDLNLLTLTCDGYARELLTLGADYDPVRFLALIRERVLGDLDG